MVDEVGRDLPSFSASVLVEKTEYLGQNDVGDGTTGAHADVIDQLQDVSGSGCLYRQEIVVIFSIDRTGMSKGDLPRVSFSSFPGARQFVTTVFEVTGLIAM